MDTQPAAGEPRKPNPKITRGYLLRLYMARADMTAIQVAERLECDPATVQRWARGALPSLRVVVPLADLLGISDAELGRYWRAS
jgi:transcriptional regulator with XRE-family HTH domain